MNWAEIIIIMTCWLAGSLSALSLGISMGEMRILRQVNRALEQMRKERE